MESFISAVWSSLFVFPIIAAVFTLPYILFQYNKYGSILLVRVIIIYSFVYYLLASYFLAILPIPPLELVGEFEGLAINLIPFSFVKEVILDPSSQSLEGWKILELFSDFRILEPILNIIMFIPLAIYLRYYFQLNFKQTILLSFALSLFFEISQISGLFGIYPKPYRIFDINDLIANTLGGIVGYLITPLVTTLLPSREKIEQISYIKGQNVTLARRTFAWFIDVFLVLLFMLIYNLFMNESYFIITWMVVTFVYFVSIPFLTKQTIGKWIVQIKTDSLADNRFNIFARDLIIFLLNFNLWSIMLLLIPNLHIEIALTVQFIYLFMIFIHVVSCLFKQERVLWYEKFTNTNHISTIELEEDEECETEKWTDIKI